MLPLSLLKTAQGQPMLVELKNGDTYNGNLVNCDTWMNINLREVICTSKDGDRFWKMPECYIRGNSVKYIRVPNEIWCKKTTSPSETVKPTADEAEVAVAALDSEEVAAGAEVVLVVVAMALAAAEAQAAVVGDVVVAVAVVASRLVVGEALAAASERVLPNAEIRIPSTGA
ncbi:hypothetical protein Poli38472_001642 [Pythium oligandrum]|uniref:U6 snRNA-associated Sm-like protein LSm4 n=1 Tax=Pythium oligandrum TaxID=41045 RepID=A0A8K1CTC2_PYTOL|nr:hypothetical protein Poli38472_001642 [Pythium oligandrum]|eukprot:TMW69486.1 hypothetical protein Poli38472_001642 [Pythium oligandrum]